MSDTQSLAERIAKMIDAEKSAAVDHSSLQASLDAINARLEKLESALPHHSHAVKNAKLWHPSQDRFALAEAVADEILESLQNQKTCTFEPNDRPCDHCGMCSSRGF